MPPKDYTIFTVQEWIKAESDKRHSMAVKYIEENVDLIDTDLQKFIDDCPTSCQLEVCEMLLKAGIDMKDYVINGSLKKWDNYIHDANSQLYQYYTIDYEMEPDDYIKETLTWKTDRLYDTIFPDAISAISAVEEA